MNEVNQQPVEITKYTDYTSYINDLVEYKRSCGEFSFRQFCQKSGFKSPTYLKWVMDKVRNMSLKSIQRFALGLDLSKRETHYLELLVNYKEAKKAETKKFYFEELLSRREKIAETPFIRERYEYLSHWYYVSIRELVAHPDFQDNPHWIQKKLRGTATVWEIKNALKILEQLQLIVRDDCGRIHQNDCELHTGREIESMAAYTYHTEVLREAAQVLVNTSHEVREFSSLASLLDRESLDHLKRKMQQFQDEVVQFLVSRQGILSQKPKRELFMLNMQLFPMSNFAESEF